MEEKRELLAFAVNPETGVIKSNDDLSTLRPLTDRDAIQAKLDQFVQELNSAEGQKWLGEICESITITADIRPAAREPVQNRRIEGK